ncbi:hypothetical protein [Haloactinomyces albus]|uniref:ABC-type glutathione transport system ATPase component n=1 Tax=Haloactinomyces albus TaxID=1352928 RepID=A0AAE3ZGL0_9ACTN|nr:hypothetical protein [Haloactinomyces albus]MDR7304548.1 ABC-type glutathione transport system ATPase component [Haloactinomyces albus]
MGRRGSRLPDLDLTDTERRTLEGWARRRKTAQEIALRARIVLVCADGMSNMDVSRRMEVRRLIQRMVEAERAAAGTAVSEAVR